MLKKRLFLSGGIAQSYPLQLDLHWTRIVDGKECAYPIKIELPEEPPYIEEGSLDSGIFDHVDNLVSLKLPGYLEKIGQNCFQSCTGLKQINIPAEVVAIGAGAFQGCINLEEIDMVPDSKLESIDDYAFNTRSKLKSLYFPLRHTYHITDFAFYGCHVELLYVDWETPLNLKFIPKGETLSVPAGTKEMYEAALKWKEFKKIIEHDL